MRTNNVSKTASVPRQKREQGTASAVPTTPATTADLHGFNRVEVVERVNFAPRWVHGELVDRNFRRIPFGHRAIRHGWENEEAES